MPLAVKIVSIFYALVFLCAFLIFARNRSLKPFYVSMWLFVLIIQICILFFENEIKNLAISMELYDPTYLIFFFFHGLSIFVLLYNSSKISLAQDRIQELISNNAILDNELRKIKKNQKKINI